MQRSKTLLTAFILSLAAPLCAGAATQEKPANPPVSTACAQELQTAACANEASDKDQVKCLRAYKRSHKGFKYSSGCNSALKPLRKAHKRRK